MTAAILKDYVQVQFFGLPEIHWTDEDVRSFIERAISLDTDVYEAIINVSHKDLYLHMAEDDEVNEVREIAEIKKTFIINAKEEIKSLIEDIQYVFDQEETEFELRRDFERVEGAAINRERQR